MAEFNEIKWNTQMNQRNNKANTIPKFVPCMNSFNTNMCGAKIVRWV